MNSKCMTSQVPIDKFREALSNQADKDASTDDDVPDPELSRFMECISVCDNDGKIHLLCDDQRSLMHTLYNSTLVIVRGYVFPQK